MTFTQDNPEPIDIDAPELPGRQIMHQRWVNLTFLHWRVEPAAVAPLLPAGTAPDLSDGSAWVGLIPFQMVGAGVGRGPAIPWLGSFGEINVRLYSVDQSGRRGVVFRSLEASRLAVVLGARLAFGVPYMWSRIRVRRFGSDVEYSSTRRWPGPRGAGGRIVVRPGAELTEPDPLAEFLTARWGLHASRLGRTLFVPNSHPVWPLHHAQLIHLQDTLLTAAGFPGVAERAPDSVLWSPGVETVFAQPFSARRALA